jgi:hypothetical protein
MAGRIAYLGNIVTQGLVLDLDAAIKGSYPGTGSIWTDVSNNNNNGTLPSSSFYTGSNYGAIVFDGTYNPVTLTQPSSSYIQNFTIQSWIAYEPSSSAYHSVLSTENFVNSAGWYYGVHIINTNQIGYRIWKTNGSSYLWNGLLHSTNGTYAMYTLTVSVQGSINAYVNTTNVNTLATDGTPLKYTGASPWFAAEGTKGNVPVLLFYNRALSQAEITQNFNALRGRYGI